VPNGQIANVSIETFSSRDMFWFHHTVGCATRQRPGRCARSSLVVRRLESHHAVDRESVRARFLRFGPSSLDIELFAYVVAKDWSHFLEIQEELLLGIMEIVEQAGTAIALPSQTLHRAEAGPLAPVLQPAPGRGEGA
jgi:MscS family membrane protein